MKVKNYVFLPINKQPAMRRALVRRLPSVTSAPVCMVRGHIRWGGDHVLRYGVAVGGSRLEGGGRS